MTVRFFEEVHTVSPDPNSTTMPFSYQIPRDWYLGVVTVTTTGAVSDKEHRSMQRVMQSIKEVLRSDPEMPMFPIVHHYDRMIIVCPWEYLDRINTILSALAHHESIKHTNIGWMGVEELTDKFGPFHISKCPQGTLFDEPFWEDAAIDYVASLSQAGFGTSIQEHIKGQENDIIIQANTLALTGSRFNAIHISITDTRTINRRERLGYILRDLQSIIGPINELRNRIKLAGGSEIHLTAPLIAMDGRYHITGLFTTFEEEVLYERSKIWQGQGMFATFSEPSQELVAYKSPSNIYKIDIGPSIWIRRQ